MASKRRRKRNPRSGNGGTTREYRRCLGCNNSTRSGWWQRCGLAERCPICGRASTYRFSTHGLTRGEMWAKRRRYQQNGWAVTT